MNTRTAQMSAAEVIANADFNLIEWARRVGELAPALYPVDPALSLDLQHLVSRVSSVDLVCIGTDDPTAPAPDSSTKEILGYLFARRPELGAEFRRIIARADQIVGRRVLLATVFR